MTTNIKRLLTTFLILALVFGADFSLPTPALAVSCGFGTDIGGGQCRGYITSGTTWTVPADWNSANNTIEAIGGGGGGSYGDASWAGGAGGGGAYSKATNIAYTPGHSIAVQVGGAGAAGTSGPHHGGAGTPTFLFDDSNAATSTISYDGRGGVYNGSTGSTGGLGGPLATHWTYDTDNGHAAYTNNYTTMTFNAGGNSYLIGRNGYPTAPNQKVYVEVTVNATTFGCGLGFINGSTSLTHGWEFLSPTQGFGIYSNGNYRDGAGPNDNTTVLSSFGAGDRIGIAFDSGAGKAWFRKNNGAWDSVIGGSQDPATGAGGIAIATLAGPYFLATDCDAVNGDGVTAAFEAPFTDTAPSGYTGFGGLTMFAGGNGGDSGPSGNSGGGGGGAGGPNGAGANGGVGGGGSVGNSSGGGGGGNGGGSAGTQPPIGVVGGNGGNNFGGTGGGAGGASTGSDGTAGTNGGGGGGGSAGTISGTGGAGGTGTEWDATHGSGGGGGGAGFGNTSGGVGGAAANYGGGGGGSGGTFGSLANGGVGAQGIIIITYTPSGGGGATGRVIRLIGHVRLRGGVRLR
jgi:hypothetical protein